MTKRCKEKNRVDADDHTVAGCVESESVDLTLIRKILDESAVSGKKGLIAVLQKAQDAYGYIPRPVVNEINRKTGVSTSSIYALVTFYDQFSTERRGKFTIKTCSGTACQVRGGKKSLEVVKKKLGVDVGDTTEDYQFTLETAGCLGACAISPAMLINKQLIGRATHDKIAPVIDQHSVK